MASRPAITRNTSAYPMYIRPIFLWSTVVTQACNTSRVSGRAFGADVRSIGPVSGIESAILMECCEISNHSVEIVIVQMHRGHQTTRLHPIGVVDPLPSILWRVLDRAG